MEPAVMTPTTPETNGMSSLPDSSTLLVQLRAKTADEKRFLVRELLRDLLGDKPEGEWHLANDDFSTFLHLMSAQRHAQLTLTPERLAEMLSQDRSKDRPHSEIVALLQRGDENEVKEWLARRGD